MENKGYRHPLDMSGGDEKGVETFAARVTVNGGDVTLNLPLVRGHHRWITTISFPAPVEVLARGGIQIDMENLAHLSVRCWVCDLGYAPRMGLEATPCPGDPKGRYVPTRDEFNSWTDEQKGTWADTMFNDD